MAIPVRMGSLQPSHLQCCLLVDWRLGSCLGNSVFKPFAGTEISCAQLRIAFLKKLLGGDDTGLEVSIEEGSLGLRGLIQSGFVLLTVTPFPIVCAAHLDQAEDVLEALLEVVRQEGVQDGIGTAVGIGEDHNEVKHAFEGRRGIDGHGDGGDIEYVEREPAENEDGHHDGHHPGDLLLRLFPLGGAHADSRGLHLDDDEQVAKTNDGEGHQEPQDEGVDNEPCVPRPRFTWPVNGAAALSPLVAPKPRIDHDGQDDQQRESPDGHIDHLGRPGSPPLGRLDGVDDSQVPVDAHDRQAEDAGELIDAIHSHDHPADGLAKGPVDQSHLHGQEGQTQHEELIRDGQVEDVNVGDGLHLGIAEDDVNDQRVATQANDADHEIDEREDCIAGQVIVWLCLVRAVGCRH
ncbi:hypothetical protein D623_10030274 [Myotis brandtii]|uniref:Uncharacterized protein n=1 Tax=Myotis brandtii TaxID=109478 RepID=S7PB83_MYOBR|nr:hypothetical protein D623_10030274 [Myotis brandtii]